MNRRLKTYTLMRPAPVKNEWSEETLALKKVRAIRAAVSTASGKTLEQNQALRISSTHIALTHDDVRAGDRFGGYVVDYVIPDTRWKQLFLTREEALNQ